MKKYLYLLSFIAVGLFTLSACGDDDENDGGDDGKSRTALACVEQMIDGCIDISSEVGDAKIGEPHDLYRLGKIEQALYAVESWYSWHSKEDYANNIRSIRNTYYGSLDGTVSSKSLSAVVAKNKASLDNSVKQAISAAIEAINAIPTPFRNNIGSTEAKNAMDACTDLCDVLEDLKGYFQNTNTVNTDDILNSVVDNYVDVVVLPTYKALKEKNAALNNIVKAFAQNPSDDNFKAVCDAWLAARQPWETSEAFLFGPVDALGLDPNMDSWPLDQSAIVDILNSGNFDNLNWSDGDNDDDIEAKQSVRGFHTLEFLAFKNGKARTMNDGTSTDPKDLDYTSANKASWANYMRQVAYLLEQDANSLYAAWTESYEGGKSYAAQFKAHTVK